MPTLGGVGVLCMDLVCCTPLLLVAPSYTPVTTPVRALSLIGMVHNCVYLSSHRCARLHRWLLPGAILQPVGSDRWTSDQVEVMCGAGDGEREPPMIISL